MTEDDRERFFLIWTAAWENTGKTPTAGAIGFAFECLKDLDLSDITKALSAHAMDPDTGQYPPKPADITKYLGGGKGDRAALAFSAAMKAASSTGAYESVSLTDPITAWVIYDMGGWQNFCAIDLGEDREKLPFFEREFCNRYAGYITRPPPGAPPSLIGIVEHTNERLGYDNIPEPIAIGRDGRVAIPVDYHDRIRRLLGKPVAEKVRVEVKKHAP